MCNMFPSILKHRLFSHFLYLAKNDPFISELRKKMNENGLSDKLTNGEQTVSASLALFER